MCSMIEFCMEFENDGFRLDEKLVQKFRRLTADKAPAPPRVYKTGDCSDDGWTAVFI